MARKPSRRSQGRGAKDEGPLAADQEIGKRLRQRRMFLDMSQAKLGEALGVTFQQVQKYERASNRISASRLLDIARVLSVPIMFFFEGLEEAGAPESVRTLAEPQAEYHDDVMQRRETVELARAYYKIKDPAVRRRLFELIKTLARSGESEPEKT